MNICGSCGYEDPVHLATCHEPWKKRAEVAELQNGELRKALEWACRGKRGNRDCYMCAASPGMKHYDDVPCKILNVAGSCQRPAPPCHCSCNPYCRCECHAAKPVDDPCCSRIGCGWVRSEHKLKGGRGCSAFVEKGWGTEKPVDETPKESRPIGDELRELAAKVPPEAWRALDQKRHPFTCGECRAEIRTDVCPKCAEKRVDEKPDECGCLCHSEDYSACVGCGCR